MQTAAIMRKEDAILPDDAVISRISRKLESVFSVICQDRMADIPVLNDKIKIQAVGFQDWNDSYLGVMVTPWFMNLMLLPGKMQNWDDQQELTSLMHTFPSGSYEFLMGFAAGIGRYQSCSLFSPMFEFADNEAAIETAKAVIKELMNPDNLDQGDIDNQQIEKIWYGLEEPHQDNEDAEKLRSSRPQTPEKTFTDKIHQPISRRELLRGAPFLDDD